MRHSKVSGSKWWRECSEYRHISRDIVFGFKNLIQKYNHNKAGKFWEKKAGNASSSSKSSLVETQR